MERVGLLLRLLDPWNYGFLRLSVTLALASSLKKSFSLQCSNSEVSTAGPCILATECLNMNASYVLSLYQPLLDKSFMVWQTLLHNPSDVLSHFLVTHPLIFHTDSILSATDSESNWRFWLPCNWPSIHEDIKRREARSPWPSGRKLVTLQTSVPFCVTRHTTLSCDLKCGVSSYSRINMTGPIPVRFVSVPPEPILSSLVLLWELHYAVMLAIPSKQACLSLGCSRSPCSMG